MDREIQQPRDDDNQDHDRIFSDPTLAQTAAEDPLFRFLNTHWKQVLLVVGALFAGYFGNQAFQETYRNSMKRAAELFSGLQTQVAQIKSQRDAIVGLSKEQQIKQADSKASEEDKKQAQKKLDDAQAELKQMQDRAQEMIVALADTRDPYDKLAQLYRAELAASGGDAKSALGYLQGASAWQDLKIEDRGRFFAESAAFNLSAMLLDQGEGRTKAFELLQQLSDQGSYLAVSAAQRLAQVASSAEERNTALSALQKVMERFPENSALLEPELQRLQ